MQREREGKSTTLLRDQTRIFRKIFDRKTNPPLCNLYVSMLQRLGLEVDKFGSSTGTLTGLEASG